MVDSEQAIPYELSSHAVEVLSERQIPIEWVEATLLAPDNTRPDPADPTLRHSLRAMAEHGGRMLRVVTNETVSPGRDGVLWSSREEQAVRLHYDEQTDALYLRLDEAAIVESEEIQAGIVLDDDDQGQVVGVEILRVKERVPRANPRQLQFEVA